MEMKNQDLFAVKRIQHILWLVTKSYRQYGDICLIPGSKIEWSRSYNQFLQVCPQACGPHIKMSIT